ncbi:archease [Candidatus Woesearchaeota archaeon]|nr:archease [Candidatus Woesearchaeota archaeon]
MRRFEYFDHTADTLFRAYGDSFEEALANAVLAVYNTMVDTGSVAAVEERSFRVEAPRRETLVYDVFEEVLFLLDTESFLCHEVSSCRVTGREGSWTASLTLRGDLRADRYEVSGQVKAPTYHEMRIGLGKGKVFIQAVLDL